MIGCIGESRLAPRPFGDGPDLPEGIKDSHGTPVAPKSLYLAQLAERLGPQALKNHRVLSTSDTVKQPANSRRATYRQSTAAKPRITALAGSGITTATASKLSIALYSRVPLRTRKPP